MLDGIKATLIRRREPDRYDPAPIFEWIVEIQARPSSVGAGINMIDSFYIRQWVARNCHLFEKTDTVVWGKLVGFKEYEDAMLFYLAHV